jgi:hypothetical protein
VAACDLVQKTQKILCFEADSPQDLTQSRFQGFLVDRLQFLAGQDLHGPMVKFLNLEVDSVSWLIEGQLDIAVEDDQDLFANFVELGIGLFVSGVESVFQLQRHVLEQL